MKKHHPRTINRDFVAMPAKPKKLVSVPAHPPDVYEARRTTGTEFAERIAALRPLAPPGRKTA